MRNIVTIEFSILYVFSEWFVYNLAAIKIFKSWNFFVIFEEKDVSISAVFQKQEGTGSPTQNVPKFKYFQSNFKKKLLKFS